MLSFFESKHNTKCQNYLMRGAGGIFQLCNALQLIVVVDKLDL